MSQNRTNIVERIAAFCLVIVLVQAVFPPIRAYLNSYILTLGCIAVVVVLSLAANNRFAVFVDAPMVVSGLTLVYISTVSLFSGNTTLFNRYFNLIVLIAGFSIFRLMWGFKDERAKRVAVIALLSFASVTFVRTAFALLTDPYIARSIKSDGEYSRSVLASGVGGYEYVYFAALLGIVLFAMMLELRSTRSRIAAGGGFAACLFLVALSNYVTALLVVILGVATSLVANAKRARFGGGAIVVVFLATALLVFSQLGDSLLYALSDLTGSGRLSDILLKGGGLSTSLVEEFAVDRWPVMEQSIVCFLDNPIIGLVGLTPTLGPQAVVGLAGQHSFFLDSFAYFGIVGGILLMLSVLIPFFKMVRMGMPLRLLLPVALGTVVLLTFNNATDGIGIVAFFLLPYFAETLSSKKRPRTIVGGDPHE